MIPMPFSIQLSGYIMMVASGFAILLNSYVLFVFVWKRKYVKPYMLLVGNLALSDLLLAIAGLFVRGPGMLWSDFYTMNGFTMTLCIGAPYVYNTLAYASSVAVVFITYDRWCAIVSPINHKLNITRHRVIRAVSLAWLSYFIYIIIMIILVQTETIYNKYSELMSRCAFTTTRMGDLTVLITHTIFFVLPFGMTAFYYGGIIYEMVQIRMKEYSKNVPKRKSKYRTFAFISVLVILFFLSWFPNYVVSWMTYGGAKLPLQIKLACFVMFYTNLFTDPLVYALSCPLIRGTMSAIFRKENTANNSSSCTNENSNKPTNLRKTHSIYGNQLTPQHSIRVTKSSDSIKESSVCQTDETSTSDCAASATQNNLICQNLAAECQSADMPTEVRNKANSAVKLANKIRRISEIIGKNKVDAITPIFTINGAINAKP